MRRMIGIILVVVVAMAWLTSLAVAAEKAGAVKVCKLDVDGNPNVAGQFGIRSIPTLLLFKGGQNVGQLVGNVPKGAIEELLKKV